MFLPFAATALESEVSSAATGVSLEEVPGPLDLVRNGKRWLFFAIVDLLGLLDGILSGRLKTTNGHCVLCETERREKRESQSVEIKGFLNLFREDKGSSTWTSDCDMLAMYIYDIPKRNVDQQQRHTACGHHSF